MVRGIIGLVAVAFAVSAANAQQPPTKDDARVLEDHVRKVVVQTEPSVVAVIVSHAKYPKLPGDVPGLGKLGKYLDPPPPDNGRQPGFFPQIAYEQKLDLGDPQNVADNLFGSGIVLDPAGLILTPYHLIEGATKIYVRTSSGKGSYADFHAYDARSDLAVLKLIEPIGGMKPIRMGDVRVSAGSNGEKPTAYRGMFVLSMGHAQAAGASDGSASVSFGVLSNVRRRITGFIREDSLNRTLPQYGVLLQTDARVTLGCSGAALLDLDGKLIGITTPMAAVTGAETSGGFAIPMDANYRRIIDVLAAGKEVEYGFLGVSFLPDPTRLEGGLRVKEVALGTPAHAAGLVGSRTSTGRDGDAIISIDGNPIKEQDDLFLYVGAALAGTKLTMMVNRPGNLQPLKFEIGLIKFDHPLPWLATVKSPAVHGLRIEYYHRSMFAVGVVAPPIIHAGVSVREVEPGSPAAAKFKTLAEPASRWRITHVNGKSVTNPSEFYREVQGKDSIRLRLYDPTDADREREITLP